MNELVDPSATWQVKSFDVKAVSIIFALRIMKNLIIDMHIVCA